MNQWEARLKQWGVTLIFIGLGSYVLPMIGLQFRLLDLFGSSPAAGIIVAAAGAALLALDFIKKRALSAINFAWLAAHLLLNRSSFQRGAW